MTFVKWITCSVDEGNRDRFSAAQQRWSEIATEPGLVAQVGGWDQTTGDAYLLGCWADRSCYQAFMSARHDDVAKRSGQRGTYQRIEVVTGESMLAIPGHTGTLADAVSGGIFLRVADCRVHPGRQDHFTAVQRDIWIPAMATADGMLGGLFSQLAEDRYLVTTWWSSIQAHRRYATTDVPGLRHRAAANEDIADLQNHALILQPEWRIQPLAA
jgi:heme-degrading monooxygenase HmoA